MFALIAAFDLRPYLVPAVIASATLMLMMRLRRSRRSEMAGTEPATASGAKAERVMPAEARQWQVELHDLARSTRAELDTRLAALQQLIIEADRRIESLERLERGAGEKSLTPRPHFDPPADRDETAGPRTRAIYAMADAGLNAAAIANRLKERLSEVETTLRLRRG